MKSLRAMTPSSRQQTAGRRKFRVLPSGLRNLATAGFVRDTDAMTEAAANARRCQPILALDVADRRTALDMLDRTGADIPWVKIGLRLFTALGPDFVRDVADRGPRVFLDLKLHDIPNTVADAVASLAELPVDMATVHAFGGSEMLRQAVAAADRASGPRLLAVTVLTSMDGPALRELGVADAPDAQVARLAGMALEARVPGLVCSPRELPALRDRFGADPTWVAPGIRPADGARGDQKRVATPAEAADAGADFIVIGRPILDAPDPAAAARAVAAELNAR